MSVYMYRYLKDTNKLESFEGDIASKHKYVWVRIKYRSERYCLNGEEGVVRSLQGVPFLWLKEKNDILAAQLILDYKKERAKSIKEQLEKTEIDISNLENLYSSLKQSA